MKTKGQTEKWVRVVLGVVCALLVINLILQFGGVRAGASRILVSSAARRPLKGSAQNNLDELSRYDPQLRLDLLKKLQTRPLPKVARDPFELHRPAPPAPAPAPVAPPPPPPPPIPLKALGYTEKVKGRQEAFVGDNDQTYVVHENETFGQRYRVLKITPRSIQIEDETSHQTVELPFAQ